MPLVPKVRSPRRDREEVKSKMCGFGVDIGKDVEICENPGWNKRDPRSPNLVGLLCTPGHTTERNVWFRAALLLPLDTIDHHLTDFRPTHKFRSVGSVFFAT